MKVITPKFRVSYPNLFTAKLNQLSGKEEYSVVALFDKDADLSKLKAACTAAVKQRWGDDKENWPTNLKMPLRDQADRAKNGTLPDGYQAGAMYLNLKSTYKPQVVDQSVQPIIDPTELYAGCNAIASITAYAYDAAGNRGVSFGLNHVQKHSDGEHLSTRTDATADFAPLEGAGDLDSSDELFS